MIGREARLQAGQSHIIGVRVTRMIIAIVENEVGPPADIGIDVQVDALGSLLANLEHGRRILRHANVVPHGVVERDTGIHAPVPSLPTVAHLVVARRTGIEWSPIGRDVPHGRVRTGGAEVQLMIVTGRVYEAGTIGVGALVQRPQPIPAVWEPQIVAGIWS